MTEETGVKTVENEATHASSLELTGEMMDKFMAVASVEAVYGKPIQKGDTLIIPTAEVVSIMGFGIGDSGKQNGGGGGGGQTHSRPVAIVIAGPEGIRVEPVVDVTKIALAMFTAAGFMAATLMRMMNPKRR
jgi:uncharacterized spore protein YtfJ